MQIDDGESEEEQESVESLEEEEDGDESDLVSLAADCVFQPLSCCKFPLRSAAKRSESAKLWGFMSLTKLTRKPPPHSHVFHKVLNPDL